MKKILFLLLCLWGVMASAQIQADQSDGTIYKGHSSATLNGLNTKPDGLLVHNSELQTLWWWNGTEYIDLLAGGVTDTEIVAAFLSQHPNVDLDSTDDADNLGQDGDLGQLTISDNGTMITINDQAITSAKIAPTGIRANGMLYVLGGTSTAGDILAKHATGDYFEWVDPSIISGTDNQTLSLSGALNDQLTISDGNTIDLSGLAGSGTNNDKFTNTTLIDGYTFTSGELTTGRELFVYGGFTDIEVTLGDIATDGQKFTIWAFDTGNVNVALSGVNGEEVSTVDSTAPLTYIYVNAVIGWQAVGNETAYTSTVEIYPYADAVGLADTNNVTYWGTASTTKGLESANVGENYALSSTATSDVVGNSYTYVDLSNVFIIGNTYRFTIVADEGTCNDLRWYTAPEGGGSFIQSQSFSGSGYQTYTYDWVANATGIRHMLYHLGAPSIGEVGYLASMLIEDITP